jgi:hypothetical protein
MQNHQASQQGLQCEVAQDARHAQSQDADLAPPLAKIYGRLIFPWKKTHICRFGTTWNYHCLTSTYNIYNTERVVLWEINI